MLDPDRIDVPTGGVQLQSFEMPVYSGFRVTDGRLLEEPRSLFEGSEHRLTRQIRCRDSDNRDVSRTIRTLEPNLVAVGRFAYPKPGPVMFAWKESASEQDSEKRV